MNQIHNTSPLKWLTFIVLILIYIRCLLRFLNKEHFKAAQLLCISQSAVSHALQRLRVQLKDELFVA